jgi:transcriptional regulator with XRE-family HTH domain
MLQINCGIFYSKDGIMSISIEQIKAARAMLGLTAGQLADISGVGGTTIRRYEMGEGLPNANLQNIMKIKCAFEAKGIEFTGDPLKNPGVTLHLAKGDNNE